MTKPTEPEALEPCPFCGEAPYVYNHHVSCRCGCALGEVYNGDDGIFGSNAEAIAAWNRRAPAQPVADAGRVTDADHEAAAAYLESMGQLASADRARNPATPSGGPLSQAFARHRLQSVAAATAAKDAEIARLKGQFDRYSHEAADAQEEVARLREGIERALCCTPSIQSERSQFHGVGETHKIVYDCGNPWEILRVALSEAREAGALANDSTSS